MLYGNLIQETNFVAEYTSFFVPKTSGTYTFELTNSDDYAALFFDSGTYFQCCPGGIVDIPSVSTNAIFQSYTVTGAGTSTAKFTLQAGVAYPIKITYLNRVGTAVLNAAFVDPSGTTHTDWSGYLANSSDLSKLCPKLVTTTSYTKWNGTQTTTSTTYTTLITGTDGLPTSDFVIVIETPVLSSSSSSTGSSFSSSTGSSSSSFETSNEPSSVATSSLVPSSSSVSGRSSITSTAVTSSQNSSSSENIVTEITTEYDTLTETIYSLVTVTVYNSEVVHTTRYETFPWTGTTTTSRTVTINTIYRTM